MLELELDVDGPGLPRRRDDLEAAGREPRHVGGDLADVDDGDEIRGVDRETLVSASAQDDERGPDDDEGGDGDDGSEQHVGRSLPAQPRAPG